VVSTALELIEAEGLQALSARKLASKLGCEAMSLYNHVANMDDLYDAIVDRLLGSLLPIGSDSVAAIDKASQAYLTLASKWPEAFVLIATRRWHTPDAVAAAGSFVEAFQRMGCDANESLRRVRILGAYLNGAGMALAAWRKSKSGDAEAGGRSVEADLKHGLAQLLDSLTPPLPAPQHLR
jgi:AcrR family transcriptional regulator